MMKEKAVKKNIQRYESYKDSGVEWLGEIPEHWEVKKFKFVLNQSKGLTITKQNLINEGVFCVNYGEIHSKYGFELDTSKHKLKCVNEEYLKTDSNSLLNKGDFVFADTSEDIEGSGNFTHLKSSDKTFAGYHTVIARPKIKIESLFLAFIFDSISYRNQIRKKVKGVKVYSITQSVLKETYVWIPRLQEQTKIAQFLDDKTTKIDDAIAIKEQQINLLKERKQILIHKAVTRGLDDNVTLKDSGVEWIGEIPEGWEVKPIKYLGKIINGYAFNSGEFKDEGVRVMKISNIQTMRIDWTDESFIDDKYYQSLPQFRINENDLVFALTRPIISTGIKASIVDTDEKILLNQRNAVLKPSKKLFKKWIYFVILDTLFTQSFDREIDKTGQQPNISTSSIGNIKIPFPCLEEQKEISAYIETASQKIETAIGLKQQEITKLKEYKSSLINGVVTGKVRVC